eukprot:GHVS01099190.1.p1 GENE.GHVS01099190.1~~GHVS01099190.1.p1  ORF type:complete len:427 (+),score=20.94 GHVS01099190.1:71-1282(+)
MGLSLMGRTSNAAKMFLLPLLAVVVLNALMVESHRVNTFPDSKPWTIASPEEQIERGDLCQHSAKKVGNAAYTLKAYAFIRKLGKGLEQIVCAQFRSNAGLSGRQILEFTHITCKNEGYTTSSGLIRVSATSWDTPSITATSQMLDEEHPLYFYAGKERYENLRTGGVWMTKRIRPGYFHTASFLKPTHVEYEEMREGLGTQGVVIQPKAIPNDVLRMAYLSFNMLFNETVNCTIYKKGHLGQWKSEDSELYIYAESLEVSRQEHLKLPEQGDDFHHVFYRSTELLHLMAQLSRDDTKLWLSILVEVNERLGVIMFCPEDNGKEILETYSKKRKRDESEDEKVGKPVMFLNVSFPSNRHYRSEQVYNDPKYLEYKIMESHQLWCKKDALAIKSGKLRMVVVGW